MTYPGFCKEAQISSLPSRPLVSLSVHLFPSSCSPFRFLPLVRLSPCPLNPSHFHSFPPPFQVWSRSHKKKKFNVQFGELRCIFIHDEPAISQFPLSWKFLSAVRGQVPLKYADANDYWYFPSPRIVTVLGVLEVVVRIFGICNNSVNCQQNHRLYLNGLLAK